MVNIKKIMQNLKKKKQKDKSLDDALRNTLKKYENIPSADDEETKQRIWNNIKDR
ncbi:hypothetical protein [Vallitalea guaymasensis]|uniref:hypothetical protein n=1 Tax=Vallitalea guaymasensis TaxID=1185412 RepID=UPI00187D4394|nr:hypothetical protein [Vallitalea guaymasensis]